MLKYLGIQVFRFGLLSIDPSLHCEPHPMGIGYGLDGPANECLEIGNILANCGSNALVLAEGPNHLGGM